MMLNDLDTMCLVKKMNLVTTHHRFIANITSTIAQFLQAYFHIHDATCEVLATAVPSDVGLTTVLANIRTQIQLSLYPCLLVNISNCVFQFSQNPVHGMPSSMTANTDNDHQAPKLKRRRQYLPNLHKFIQNSDFFCNSFMILLDVLHFQSDVFHSDRGCSDRSDV